MKQKNKQNSKEITNLLADADVPLADEDTGVMDRLGHSKLEDLSLQTAFQEILNFQAQNVIELHAAFVQDTNADETAEQSIAFKQPARILVF